MSINIRDLIKVFSDINNSTVPDETVEALFKECFTTNIISQSTNLTLNLNKTQILELIKQALAEEKITPKDILMTFKNFKSNSI